MQPGPIAILVVTLFALFLGWSYSRGESRGVPLYILWVAIVISLAAAAVAEVLVLLGLVEVLNVTAIGLALAGLAASPRLWREQIRADWDRASQAKATRARDFLSWRGWLAPAKQLGAGPVALAGAGLFAAALGLNFFTGWRARPESDLVFVLLALMAPGLFGGLSAIWIYRGLNASLGAGGLPQRSPFDRG